MKFARDLGRRGRVVDEYRAFGDAGERAVRPERHLAQVVVVADAAHDEVLPFGRGLRRRRAPAAMLGNPFLGLGGGPVVDRDLVAAFGLEMSRHGVAHHAETEKRNLCHHRLPERTVRDRLECPYDKSDCDGAAAASTHCARVTLPATLPATVPVDRVGAHRMVAADLSPLECAMTVTKDDVLAGLAKVAC